MGTQHSPKSSKVNFVARNARNAFNSENRLRRSRSSEELREAVQRSKQEQSLYDLQVRGTVPDYLVKRKEEWAEKEKELLSLPVRQCDTLKYKQRKMDLEVKLNELDEAIKIFSKKKVFVRVS